MFKQIIKVLCEMEVKLKFERDITLEWDKSMHFTLQFIIMHIIQEVISLVIYRLIGFERKCMVYKYSSKTRELQNIKSVGASLNETFILHDLIRFLLQQIS